MTCDAGHFYKFIWQYNRCIYLPLLITLLDMKRLVAATIGSFESSNEALGKQFRALHPAAITKCWGSCRYIQVMSSNCKMLTNRSYTLHVFHNVLWRTWPAVSNSRSNELGCPTTENSNGHIVASVLRLTFTTTSLHCTNSLTKSNAVRSRPPAD
jgi:hypothetical protein